MKFRDLRFFLALPFDMVAQVCAGIVARIDERYANAVNEGWCDYCGCWNGHAHPSCEGAA